MEDFKTKILLMTGVFFITELKQVKSFKTPVNIYTNTDGD